MGRMGGMGSESESAPGVGKGARGREGGREGGGSEDVPEAQAEPTIPTVATNGTGDAIEVIVVIYVSGLADNVCGSTGV